MKTILLSITLALLAGCVSAPMTPEQKQTSIELEAKTREGTSNQRLKEIQRQRRGY
jgi:starvation-inducible outer membrane lipoprotein